MNLKRVAQLAKLSTATVSRTINGSHMVAPSTALRVQQAIEELGFLPNSNARALGTGKSRLYGLIISDILNPFFPEIVKGFDDIAGQHGQEVLLANTDYDAHRTEASVRRMLGRKVDGVAIMTSEMDERITHSMTSRNVPLVFLDTGSPGLGISNIAVDYGAGVLEAVQHLLDLGHQRIAFIAGPLHLRSAKVRREAFLRAMQSHGLPVHPELMEEGNHHLDGGGAAMRRLLKLLVRPTAVMASNDLSAIGAIGVLHEENIPVPRAISVVGFDDIGMSSAVFPPLTTVRLPRLDIATLAFRALREQADGLKEGTQYHVLPKLIVRKSTAQVTAS